MDWFIRNVFLLALRGSWDRPCKFCHDWPNTSLLRRLHAFCARPNDVYVQHIVLEQSHDTTKLRTNELVEKNAREGRTVIP